MKRIRDKTGRRPRGAWLRVFSLAAAFFAVAAPLHAAPSASPNFRLLQDVFGDGIANTSSPPATISCRLLACCTETMAAAPLPNVNCLLSPGFIWDIGGVTGTPDLLSISVAGGYVVLTWRPVDGVAEYRIFSVRNLSEVPDEDLNGKFNGTRWTGPAKSDVRFYRVVTSPAP